MNDIQPYNVVVVGAGPAGLACAIEAKKQCLSHVVIDKGSIVDAIRRFPANLTFFSTPELLEIGDIPFTTATFRPTRVECLRYYQSVAKYYQLTLRLGHNVESLQRNGSRFLVKTSHGFVAADNLVIATGYFDNPNPLDIPGANLSKVRRYYSEPFEFAGRNIAVVGGKNSAVEIALDLFRNGADVTLIHRGSTLSDGVKYWILPDIENRIKAGEIKALFETRVEEIHQDSIVLEGKHNLTIPNDVVFVMIGYRPNNSLLEQVGVKIEPESLAPKHNPETMETNINGVFIAGSIAAGKFNNKIFIENGRVHGKKIVDAIRKVH